MAVKDTLENLIMREINTQCDAIFIIMGSINYKPKNAWKIRCSIIVTGL